MVDIRVVDVLIGKCRVLKACRFLKLLHCELCDPVASTEHITKRPRLYGVLKRRPARTQPLAHKLIIIAQPKQITRIRPPHPSTSEATLQSPQMNFSGILSNCPPSLVGSNEPRELPYAFVPGDHDVICGKGELNNLPSVRA